MSECGQTNKRFAARNAEQSLQGTNMRCDRANDQCDSSIRALKGGSPTQWLGEQHNEPRSDYDIKGHSYQTHDIQYEHEHGCTDPESEQHNRSSGSVEDMDSNHGKHSDNSSEYTQYNQGSVYQEEAENAEDRVEMQEEPMARAEAQHEESLPPAAYVPHTENDRMDNGNEADDSDKHRRGNTRQKEADCAGQGDISVQMYRFMKHNDLKRQINDLCRREQSFVVKQCWDEALRLREMRNELILLKNKNLYENQDLNIDEQTRKSGLSIIEAREKINSKRIKIRDSTLYSDEAKDLWQQWVREDDELAETETNAMRDLLLQELEDEWQSLALRDKNRISQLYDRVMNRSDLQDEQKLATVIRDANDRQKQYMNYLAE